jgi:hypothetical protein
MTFQSFERYVQSTSFCKRGETDFHFGLLPIPYAGDLATANIFILLLNPGLSHGDYYAEYEARGFRDAHVKNLYQQDMNSSYPFHMLDPIYSWHPGFVYWEKKFNNILTQLSSDRRITYQESLSYLSKHVACLELSGYHSKNYKALPSKKRLMSTTLMIDFVQKDLLPRARDNEISIIVTRGSSHWGISETETNPAVVVYAGAETQAAHLTSGSRGGAEIIRKLSA